MTPRQQRLLDHVREVLTDTGNSPSLREIAAELEMSLTQVKEVVDTLVAAGFLVRGPERTRNLRLPGEPDLRAASTGALISELQRRGEEIYQRRSFAASALTRTCAADTCSEPVKDNHLMCRRHWFMLPDQLQNGLRRTSRMGETARFDGLLAKARGIADGRFPELARRA